MSNSLQKQLFYLSIIATIFSIVVIGVGAYTRLAHAGLGCPDWPGCYGLLISPTTADEIALAQSNFPGMTITSKLGWIEMFHRYIAGALLLLILYITILSWKTKKYGQPYKLALSILGLAVLQAAFGMWTVTLKLWPQVVVSHLLGGMLTLSLLFLLSLKIYHLKLSQLAFNHNIDYNINHLKIIGVVALILAGLQIALGGWTSANYASLACVDFPTCQGKFWPKMDIASGLNLFLPLGDNYLGGKLDSTARTAIHMMHRVGALITSLVILLLIYLSKKASNNFGKARNNFDKILLILIIVLVTQLLLGVLNVVAHLPLLVAVAHTIVAGMLLLSLIAYNFYLHSMLDRKNIR